MSWTPPAQDSLVWSPPSSDEPIGDKSVEPEATAGSFVKDLLRQLGLTTRYAIEGGLGLADLAAEPMRMALRAALPEGSKWAPQGTGGQAIANTLGLPQPQGGAEEFIGDISRSVSGAGAPIKAAGALANKVVPAAQGAMGWLAANPALQAQAATGAGIGAGIARESELGPYGTLAAQFAGAIATPSVIRAGGRAVEPIKDIGATIAASTGIGRKWGVRRIEIDAIERGLGESKEAAKIAMYNATEPVQGATPTVGQAVAEYNMRQPESVSAGWLARLEKDLTGAPGVEDVMPSVMRRQEHLLNRSQQLLWNSTKPLREPVLDGINKRGGLYAKAIERRLDDLAADPKISGDPSQARAVMRAKEYLIGLGKNGRVDAQAAYAYRKSVNKAVARAAQEEGGVSASISSAEKKAQGVTTHKIQLAIDEVIEQAAKPLGMGGRWKAYLGKYSEGMKKIGSYGERSDEAAEIAAKVKPIGSQVVAGEMPKAPTLLNRKMMFANWALSRLGADANPVVVKNLTAKLADPKAFVELLNRSPKDPLRQFAIEMIRRGEQAAAMGAITNSDEITQ